MYSERNGERNIRIVLLLVVAILIIVAVLLGMAMLWDEPDKSSAVTAVFPTPTLAKMGTNSQPPTPIITLEGAATAVPSPILMPTPPAQTDNTEAILSQMSLDRKIGQLLMIGMPGPQLDDATRQRIEQLGIGGIIFLDANVTSPQQVKELTQALQAAAQTAGGIPLFIGWNYEGGEIIRQQANMTHFPSNMALGAATPAADLFTVGTAVGQEMRDLGVNMNFAPVLDVNTNPNNPVIGLRSFGSNPEQAAALGEQYILGLQSAGVIAVAKHFPGHGDVDTDSHAVLPVVTVPRSTLETRELLPYQSAIAANVGGIMIGHLAVPALSENAPNQPASLSHDIVTHLLRQEMNFNAVIMTDDLGMGAITNTYNAADAAVAAIQAGNDLLLSVNSDNYPELFHQAIKQAVSTGQISEEQIDNSVRRILRLKQAYFLHQANSLEQADHSGHRQLAYELGVAAVHAVPGELEIMPYSPQLNRILIISPVTTHPGSQVGDNRSLINERLAACGLEVIEYFYDPKSAANVQQIQENALGEVSNANAAVILTYDAALRQAQLGDTSQIDLVQAIAETGLATAVISSHNPQDAALFSNIPLRIVTYGDTYGQIDGIIPFLIPQCATGNTPSVPN
jgi:beta-N-acetylhexosaminidase